jgi:hypothetical protein
MIEEWRERAMEDRGIDLGNGNWGCRSGAIVCGSIGVRDSWRGSGAFICGSIGTKDSWRGELHITTGCVASGNINQRPIGVVNTYHPSDPHLRHINHTASRFVTEVSGEVMIAEIRHPIYDREGKLVDGGHLSEIPRDCDFCPQYVGGWSIKTCSGCPNETIYVPPGYYQDYGIRKAVEVKQKEAELQEAKREIEALKKRISELEEELGYDDGECDGCDSPSGPQFSGNIYPCTVTCSSGLCPPVSNWIPD